MIQRATNLFALWTLLGTAWAWFLPDHFLWVTDGSIQPLGQSLISVLLGIIMLGMGLTLNASDFLRVLKLPWAVAAGVGLQFLIMPVAGITFATLFSLETGLAVGLILVACCPGGTASNVVAYLARANLALSVSMTMVSTIIAVILTPLLVGWLGGIFVEIDRWALFRGMITVVLLPIILGTILNSIFPTVTRQIARISPLISIFTIVLIIGGIIAASKSLIIDHAGLLLMALFMLHLTGFGLGYLLSRFLARFFGWGEAECRTCAIEVGMQNSGLGSALASTPSFSGQFMVPLQAVMAPVPAAVSAVYHVVMGSLLAAYWRRNQIVEGEME